MLAVADMGFLLHEETGPVRRFDMIIIEPFHNGLDNRCLLMGLRSVT